MKKKTRRPYQQGVNQLRSAKRNHLKGYLKGCNTVLTKHHNKDYLYADEQTAMARIVIEIRKLLVDWIPQLPKGE
jgi:hypothetical protein